MDFVSFVKLKSFRLHMGKIRLQIMEKMNSLSLDQISEMTWHD